MKAGESVQVQVHDVAREKATEDSNQVLLGMQWMTQQRYFPLE